jgi:hypothetical protein
MRSEYTSMLEDLARAHEFIVTVRPLILAPGYLSPEADSMPRREGVAVELQIADALINSGTAASRDLAHPSYCLSHSCNTCLT